MASSKRGRSIRRVRGCDVSRVIFALNAGDLDRMRFALDRIGPTSQKVTELSLLMSYFYFRTWTARRMREQIPPTIKMHIFVDSGGFSAMTLGEPIRLKDYARWLADNEKDLDVYANLDVIGDGAKTLRNQEILEAEGLSPIPVFHVNSDLRWLDQMLERGYPYIAIGGMVPYMVHGGQTKLAAWLRNVFARLRDRETKVHGFGVGTTWKIVSGFPWHSIDSSSWVGGFKYRIVRAFDTERAGFRLLNFGSQSRDAMKYAEIIRRYGFSPKDFYPNYDAMKAGAFSVMSLLRAEEWLRNRARDR